MDRLEQVTDRIRQNFDRVTSTRDQALAQTRQLTRHCSLAIRAVHRGELDLMQSHLDEASALAAALTQGLELDFPALFHTGYTQDSLKEYAEACITCALILDKPLPSPEDLHLLDATYLKGLSEVVGELRRRCLDILRQGWSQEAERLLKLMDDIFAVLVTMDYPDAITNGLRRQTDVARSIIERTRGDVTFSLRGEHLSKAIANLSRQLNAQDLPTDRSTPGTFLPDEGETTGLPDPND